jgi:hypothetical protein
MYTIINDILFDIVAFPNKLGQFILEEGNDLRENITGWKDKFQLTDDFITDAAISGTITFSICSVLAYVILNWYMVTSSQENMKSKPRNKVPDEKDKMGMLIVGKRIPMIQGFYIQSIHEVNNVSDKIIPMFQKDNSYWILLRVRLRNSFDIFGTQFQLGNGTCNTKKCFQTKDAYLVLRFKIISDTTRKNFGNVITCFMNLLNHSIDSKYYTSDFIVCAICTSTTTIPNEFSNGLKNIGYKMENYINVNAKTVNGNNTIAYSLMLPVKGVRDLFMDVYNNCLFESKKYLIDENNNEIWNGNKIIKQILETSF